MRFRERGIFCVSFGMRAHLRGVHLNAHLAQADLLNAAQIARYSELRGYSLDHRGH